MLFNSVNFIAFLSIVLLLYWLLPHKYRNVLLLLSSYYFYMCWNAFYALLIIFTTISTWGIALLTNRYEKEKIGKWLLTIGILLNLSILFTFKYYDFFMYIAADVAAFIGIEYHYCSLGYLLPVGISFYTFQAIGYCIDVYRKDIKPEKSLAVYALFVSFFPQLVAGPIERASHLLPQFRIKKTYKYEYFRDGLMLMLWGFFLKLCLADRCALYVDSVYNNLQEHNGGSYLLASVFFTFQIYGDFWGYSLIAIGTAKMLGFDMMKNFNHPYLSTSISEFWRRWHISLSTWFKDYVYIPLGGSRCSKLKCYRNLLLTMLLSGLWHGAALKYVVWGGLHGLFMCIERFLGINKPEKNKILIWVKRLVCFSFVCFLWIFFRADNLSDACTIIGRIFTDFGKPFIYYAHFLGIGLAVTIVAIQELVYEKGFHLSTAISNPSIRLGVRYIGIVSIICYLLLVGVLNGDQFIYFQF